MKIRVKRKISLIISLLLSILVMVGCTNNKETLNNEKKLVVAMSGTYYPFTFLNGDKIEGFDVDVWREIGNRLGYDIEFTTASFSGLFGLLDTNKANTISNQITVTEERKEKYLFSDPYVYSGAQIIVQEGNPKSINSFDDLKGKKVGVDLGSNYEQIIRDKDVNNEVTIVTYQNTDAAFTDLLLGRIDGVVIDKISAIVTINEKELKLELSGEPIEPVENAFPFVKNSENETLVAEVNKALNDMKEDGTFAEISNKWLKTDVTGSSTNYIKSLFISIISGLKTTLSLSIISMIIALVIGVIIALIRINNIKILKQLVEVYISFLRGTPLLVQLFLLYFGLPQIIPQLKGITAYTAAVIGLALNASAYIAEALRGAFDAIDKGQMEAALSVGMTKMQGMKRIVMPQMFRVAVPSLGNVFVDNIKGSSLAFTLGVTEALARAQMSAAASYRFFESYIAVAIVYWVTISVYNVIQKSIENKLSVY
ncbi:ABC transporter permease subunit [Clostridium sp.]|uniref:ABC transporter permease subunit n=1 Tax=Clostridium sp. TaxID=1506 RepID=UPI0025800018|nr:ABC transporter permease subunit [Clostridium sp.]MDU7239985.1 ABC transporter permease subunit [Clostridium sp.]